MILFKDVPAQVSSNLEQVFDTIDYPVEIADEADCETLKNVKEKVDFNDVTFAYDEECIEAAKLMALKGLYYALN